MTYIPFDALPHIALVLIGLMVLLIYIYPTVAAIDHHHPQRWAIGLLNLLLGWTFLGWVAALVWAYYTPQSPPPQRSGAASQPVRPFEI